MHKKGILDLRQIEFDKLEPYGFINTKRFQITLSSLKEIAVIVKELLDIKDNERLPISLIKHINEFNKVIINFIYKIEEQKEGSAELVAKHKDNLLGLINSYFIQCFDISRSSSRSLLETYVITKNFIKPNNQEFERFEDRFNKINSTLIKSNTEIKDLKNNKYLKELESNKNKSDIILLELQKKVTQQSISDYSEVFREEALKYKNRSKNWLKSGILISIVFITLIIISALTNFLPTEIITNKNVVGYNITNIITKALIIAIAIFLISFSFKQFSVNGHLQALNIQRQKALNSYSLFASSIPNSDSNARNALMIQVAKAIYEPQATGYLSDKGQQVNSGIVELTRIIGQNSN